MDADGQKNWRNISVSDGGTAGERRPSAEVEFEKAMHALLIAMQGKDGNSVNENFRNVARGHTRPLRMAIRRLREARAARNHARNYPLAKEMARVFDQYVEQAFRPGHVTGEFDKAV